MVENKPDLGVWTEHENIDMHNKGDKELVEKWRDKYTIDQLKQYAIDRDYSSFTIGDGFDFAAMKKFKFQLTAERCKKSPN